MWTATVGLVNGKHRYLTAETFGFKINSNGQQLKRRQQWTIEPFPEMTGPDGSISSAASVTSQAACPAAAATTTTTTTATNQQDSKQQQQQLLDPNEACILTPLVQSSLLLSSAASASLRTGAAGGGGGGSSNESSSSSADQDGYGEEHENVALKSHLNKYLAVDSFGNVTCDSDEKTENARFTITICSMSQGRSKDEHIFWAFKNYERGYYLGTTDDGMICCSAKMPKSRAELWHLHLLPARGASFFALKSLGRKRFARVTSSGGGGIATNTSVAADAAAAVAASSTKLQVQLDANISWGCETLFQFKYHEGGKYSLLSSDNLLLTNEGKCISLHDQLAAAAAAPTGATAAPAPAAASDALQASTGGDHQLPPIECLFTLEYHSGYLAFRDSFGQYLAAAGRSSILRSRSIGVSRDELFMFESVPIQVSLKATFNNRWVSIKQGVDLSANQTETTSRYETFQLTYHKQTHNWSIMTHDCNFWTISHNSNSSGSNNSSGSSSNNTTATTTTTTTTTNTVSVCRPGDYEGLTRGQFKLIWSDNDATFALKYVDLNRQERWISARKSGQLFVAPGGGSTNLVEPVKFVMRFQNRRLLNLRPVDGSGFVGLKGGPATSATSRQLEANKTAPDSILIEYPELPSLSFSDRNRSAAASNFTTSQASCNNGASKQVESSSSSLSASSEHQKVINVFNVKLNSTKMGQSVFEHKSQQQQQATASNNSNKPKPENQESLSSTGNDSGGRSQKEIDCGIDANNNDSSSQCLVANNDNQNQNQSQAAITTSGGGGGGGVEFASAPSVASIINSFSSAKISQQQQQQQQQANGCSEQQRIIGNSVSKLASSFEQQQQQQPGHMLSGGASASGDNNLDTASVVSSASSSASASASTNNSMPTTSALAKLSANCTNNGGTSGGSLADQVALSECCYLKALTNNKYLLLGDGTGAGAATDSASSIICDATNRACAQAWILELRSHNSIAIRASDNHAYMQLGTNGTIHLSKCEPKDASLWEF